ANPFQCACVLEPLQQLKIVVAGNAEQVPDAGLLETAKQEVADLHSSAGAARHFCLLRFVGVLTGSDTKPSGCGNSHVTDYRDAPPWKGQAFENNPLLRAASLRCPYCKLSQRCRSALTPGSRCRPPVTTRAERSGALRRGILEAQSCTGKDPRVRFGSQADTLSALAHVCFGP